MELWVTQVGQAGRTIANRPVPSSISHWLHPASGVVCLMVQPHFAVVRVRKPYWTLALDGVVRKATLLRTDATRADQRGCLSLCPVSPRAGLPICYAPSS